MAKEVTDKTVLERLERRAPARQGAVAALIQSQLESVKKIPNKWFHLEGVKSISYVRRVIVNTLKELLITKGGNWKIKRIEGKCYAQYVVKEEEPTPTPAGPPAPAK